jgi:trigger factor
MNIEQHNIDTVNAELTIKLEPGDYSERFESALKNYRKQAQLPGFRPGHVPASLIRKRFGKALLAEEINRMLQDSINNYITEKNLRVLGSPLPKDNGEVGDWDSPSEFNFTYEIGLAPEFDVTLDAGQTFDYYKVDVNDELIGRQVKDYARRYGQMSQPETSGVEDLLTITLAELDAEGNVMAGGRMGQTNVTVEYLRSEELRNKLTGVKVGDTVDLNPHDLTGDHEELAKMLNITHHDVHHLSGLFRATVTDIRHIDQAELNEELFGKVFPESGITTESAFREKIREDLVRMFARDSDWHFKRTVSRELVSRISMQLPDEFLKRWISTTSEQEVDPLALEHDYPHYSNGMRWDLIEAEIVRKYEIKVGMDDAMSYVKDLLRERFASYGIPVEDDRLTEMAKETLGKREELRNIYDTLVENRIMEAVKANCTIVEKALPYDDFVHLLQH